MIFVDSYSKLKPEIVQNHSHILFPCTFQGLSSRWFPSSQKTTCPSTVYVNFCWGDPGFQGSGVGRFWRIEVSMVNHRYWNVSVAFLQKGGGVDPLTLGGAWLVTFLNHKTKLLDNEKEWKEWKRTTEALHPSFFSIHFILVVAANFVYFLWRSCDPRVCGIWYGICQRCICCEVSPGLVP